MDEYQKQVAQQFNEIISGAIDKKELSKLKEKWEKEAKDTKTELELIEECAFCNQVKNINYITQTNYFMDYDQLRKQELDFIKKKKDKEFQKKLKNIKNAIRVAYRSAMMNDEKRLIYHLELEKRLGFQFECDYMSVYLAAKISEKIIKR